MQKFIDPGKMLEDFFYILVSHPSTDRMTTTKSPKYEHLLLYLLYAPVLGLIAYAFWRRGLGNTIIYGFVIGFILFLLVTSLEWEWSLKESTRDILWNFLAAQLFGMCLYGLWVVLLDGYGRLVSLPLGPRAALIGTGAIFLFAITLFMLRLHYRIVYGLIEVSVGALISIYRFSDTFELQKQLDPEFYFAILTAAIYVIIRGFDNIHQGAIKEPLDKLYVKLTSRKPKTA
ncbi:MAG: hypothetical protein ABIP64_16270 [Burkholderiales bacterium]